ncbi:MAG: HEAT repeat domain-containing protein [Myxococcota bacterium]
MREHTQTRTAMVDGTEMKADDAAAIHEVREIFDKFRKSLKTIGLYRHNLDRYNEYLAPFYNALTDFLARKSTLELRLEPLAFKYKKHIVFEDNSHDGNLIYPFFKEGIRCIIIKNGLSADELLRFLLLTLGDPTERATREDILTRLWKASLQYIEYIVVEGFRPAADQDGDEVEVEVEKVVAYLYRQLQSNSDDVLRFARLNMEDLNLKLDNVDQMRGVVVTGTTATAADKDRVKQSLLAEEERVLPKMIIVLFQLLELDTTEENFEDVAEAFVQHLDALLLAENFTAIQNIRERFAASGKKAQLKPQTKDMVARCAARFDKRMAESQRLQVIAQILNAGNVKDPSGLRAYLLTLGAMAVPPLVEMLEALELPQNRRVVCDVLADLGADYVPLFTSRLTHPSSNLVKDMLYVIDRINPPEKFALFGHVLKHPNVVLRLETLAVIGRNPADECWEQIKNVFLQSDDSQMRSQAARLLPNYSPQRAVPILLAAVQATESFEQRPEGERKALFSALALVGVQETHNFLSEILLQKGGLFGKKKVDELKALVIGALQASPSLPVLQLLVEVAKDPKRHGEEIAEMARQAAIAMQGRLLGG